MTIDTTQRTGLLQARQRVTKEALNSLLPEIKTRLRQQMATELMECIADGRHYCVRVRECDEMRPQDDDHAHQLLITNTVEIGLIAEIALQRWQDAEVGEYIIFDALGGRTNAQEVRLPAGEVFVRVLAGWQRTA